MTTCSAQLNSPGLLRKPPLLPFTEPLARLRPNDSPESPTKTGCSDSGSDSDDSDSDSDERDSECDDSEDDNDDNYPNPTTQAPTEQACVLQEHMKQE